MAQHLKIAHLDEDGVAAVRTLEQGLGKHVMAFDDGPPFASLTAAQLAQIKAVEEQLGVILLVYES